MYLVLYLGAPTTKVVYSIHNDCPNKSPIGFVEFSEPSLVRTSSCTYAPSAFVSALSSVRFLRKTKTRPCPVVSVNFLYEPTATTVPARKKNVRKKEQITKSQKMYQKHQWKFRKHLQKQLMGKSTWHLVSIELSKIKVTTPKNPTSRFAEHVRSSS